MANERQQIQVIDPVPLMDTGRFEHLQRIASVMARGSLIPDALHMGKCYDDNGAVVMGRDGKPLMVELPYETVLSNCFMIANQAARWGMDPFAVAQCVSVVYGRLCYEGKLVAAVIEAKLAVRLEYTYDGKPGENLGVIVSGKLPGESTVRTIKGTVADWKTSGNNSPWGRAGNYERMLAYRGAREWARRHAPGMLLGVYTDDELADLQSDGRTSQFRGGIEPVRDALSGEAGPKPKAIESKLAVATTIIENKESSPGADLAPQPNEAPGEGTEAAAAVSVGEEEGVPLSSTSTVTPRGVTKEGRDTPSDPVAGEVQQDIPPGAEAVENAAEADEAEEPTQPTDDASYQRWVFWWANNLVHSHAEASAKWKAERTTRNHLQISAETVDACKAFLGKTWPAPAANEGA